MVGSDHTFERAFAARQGVFETEEPAVVMHGELDADVIARFVTDITLGYSVFQAVKPKKRADLY